MIYILFLIFSVLAIIFLLEFWIAGIINIEEIQRLNLRLAIFFIFSALIALYWSTTA